MVDVIVFLYVRFYLQFISLDYHLHFKASLGSMIMLVVSHIFKGDGPNLHFFYYQTWFFKDIIFAYLIIRFRIHYMTSLG